MADLPPRRITLGFLLFAHLQFGAATFLISLNPAAVSGFFYHPKMIAVVHGLTLGWLSSNLIASEFRRLTGSWGRWDLLLLVCWAGGASGLPSHFWIEEFGGMGWSAGLLVITIGILAFRFLAIASLSDDGPIIRGIVSLSWINFLAIALLGLLIGLNRSYSILPGFSLHHAFGHAHLAALGWVGLALLGGWLRTPGRRPRGLPAILLAIGVLMLQLGTATVSFVLFVGEGLLRPFAWITAIGLGLSLSAALWLRRERVVACSVASRLLLAVGCLALAAAALLGLRLTQLETATERPDWIMLYGLLGLLAGLGSLVAAAVSEWLQSRGAIVAVGWLIGMPLVGFGLARTADVALRAGAVTLTVVTAISMLTAVTTSKAKRVECTRTQSAGG